MQQQHQELYPTIVMTRTSSHVDDIIEEVVEPVPSPSSPQQRRSTKPSIEQQQQQQQLDEADELVGEVRCATLSPLSPQRALSSRSVLAFLIVSNGGECETADESSWEDDDVEEIQDDEDEDEDEVGGLSMRDILASLPTTATSFIAPFPADAPSYVPSLLPTASSLGPASSHHHSAATSLSYSSITAALARHTARQPQQQQGGMMEQAVVDDSEDEESYEDGEGGDWRDDGCVAQSTRAIHSAAWTSVASGM